MKVGTVTRKSIENENFLRCSFLSSFFLFFHYILPFLSSFILLRCLGWRIDLVLCWGRSWLSGGLMMDLIILILLRIWMLDEWILLRISLIDQFFDDLMCVFFLFFFFVLIDISRFLMKLTFYCIISWNGF